MRRVAITGIGTISAAGNNLSETLDAFWHERSNLGSVSLFSTTLTYPVFEIKGVDVGKYDKGTRTLNLALRAVREAIDDAELQNDLQEFKVGVCLGTTVASQLNDLEFYRAYRSGKNVSINSVDRFLKGNLSEAVGRRVKASGPFATVVNACSSGTDAIGVALSWLRNGLCDIAIAGGADELNLIPFCGFASLGVLSDSLCAPFDRDRKGLNLGEGAGILVLEAEPVARQRGRNLDLFLCGYGLASDAYHLTAPHPEGVGLEAALRRALSEADIAPGDVCFVNAHGTATQDNDKIEGKVLNRVFGPDLTFLSTKGFTGHTLGAAGGLEAAFTAAALRKKWIPASIGFKNQDNTISIAPIMKKTTLSGNFAVSTSLAFGGNNSALVIEKRGHHT